MTDILSRARSLAGNGQPADAIAALETAAVNGDAQAATELGLWLLRGDLIERNVVLARKYLGQAAQGGSEEALLIEIALSANGTGGTIDWQAALSLLKAGAARYDYLASELALVEALDLDESGYPLQPPVGVPIDGRLNMVRYPAFLSQAERQHIANIALPSLAPSTVFDPHNGRRMSNPIRTSDDSVIGSAQEDLVIQAIYRRIATVTGTDLQQGEPMSVLRYGRGQEYKLHFDAINRSPNNRIKTVLLYLNEGYEGGQTAFPELGINLAAKAGDAVVFDGLNRDGSVNPLSRHAGLPIIRGTKWIATRWIRARRFDPWNRESDAGEQAPL